MASPVWKGRGSVGGGGVRRSVLKVLPANSRNSKLLVGQGSPRLPSFGKSAKTPLPHEVVSCGVYSRNVQLHSMTLGALVTCV